MKKKTITVSVLVLFAATIVFTFAAPSAAVAIEKPAFTMVLIVDGLRPDLINATDTPNIYKLQKEGVNFLNGHSVYPTNTRVQSTSVPTGTYPDKHGIIDNSFYVPSVNPPVAVSTGDYLSLLELDAATGGNMVLTKTLSERLHEKGMLLAALSAGSNGSGLLLNHKARHGIGIDVGFFEAGTLIAYPPADNAEILSRFPGWPGASTSASTDYLTRVLTEYLLPVRMPDSVIFWITEPDGTHHSYGVGSPQAVEAIQNSDRNIGIILGTLEKLGLYNRSDLFVISDHGFARTGRYEGLSLQNTLIKAGFKQSATSTDVVVRGTLIYVNKHNTKVVQNIVKYLQQLPWVGPIFTAANKDAFLGWPWPMSKTDKPKYEGWVDGTFSLDIIRQFNKTRGGDIAITYNWTSDKNNYGYAGLDLTSASTTGPWPGTSQESGHGSMNPWVTHNTWIGWGLNFKKGIINPVPVSNVDIVPTILRLLGMEGDEYIDGRVLEEALVGGPEEQKVPVETLAYSTDIPGGNKAYLEIDYVKGKAYITKSWVDRSGQ